MTTASGMVKVRLRGSQPYEMETLWATPVEGGVAEFFPKYTTPSNYGGVYVYVMLKCTHLNCAVYMLKWLLWLLLLLWKLGSGA